MQVINTQRERERLRLQVELPRRIHDYNISLDTFFRKNELETIFKKLVE